jgi:hypothetical protein
MDSNGEYVRYGTALRKDGIVSVSMATVPNVGNLELYAYLVFSRAPLPDTAEKGIVSSTAFETVV